MSTKNSKSEINQNRAKLSEIRSDVFSGEKLNIKNTLLICKVLYILNLKCN